MSLREQKERNKQLYVEKFLFYIQTIKKTKKHNININITFIFAYIKFTEFM